MNGNNGLAKGSVIGLITAVITLLFAFGIHISTSERDAIIALATAIVAIAPSIGAFVDHSHRSAESRLDAATVTKLQP